MSRNALGAEFTKEMRQTHTIYMPDMLHYHNAFLEAAFSYGGYRLATLPEYKNVNEKALRYISGQYNIGDGWLMAGEILSLIEQGYDRILILHPFGCLVSHVGARGIMKRIRMLYPQVRIQAIEYDYDQSKAMRESRIQLALG